ncbi:MAG: orotidine-5'-phosphate decarboxylase [Anaerolineales bacterium]
METFFSRLERRADECASLLCVGLDPHPQLLPHPTAAAAREFCLRLIEKTAPYAAAFKPNAAFFEAFGAPGWEALAAVIAAARATGASVILDAKRGDIASTARAYAQSAFEHLGAHAITLNPYLGYDAVEPFIGDPEKGAFLLCKTSNPGSADLQDLMVDDGVLLYEHVARLAQGWNAAGNIGLVVGATQPEALARVRTAAPGLWFLSPGVGAQGGDLETALRSGLRADGRGLLINVSRGIARAENPRQAAAALRDEILRLQGEINAH